MVIPASGAIYLSQFNTELGKATNTAISLGQADLRQMLQIPSGAIYMSSGRGRGVSPSAAAWGAGAFVTFVVPWYNTLYVEVRGAGGGGGQGAYYETVPVNPTEANGGATSEQVLRRGATGGAGSASVFYSSTALIGYGGGGGQGGFTTAGATGAAGGASGGSYNAAGGGSGGGGGSGNGGAGGAGGVAAINFSRVSPGAPVPYAGITVQVGVGGGSYGSAAGGGYIYVSWS